MYQARKVDGPNRLSALTSFVAPIIPHQFSGCGAFNLKSCALHVGHSNFSSEYGYLYVTQGFLTDPSVRLLQMTRIGTVTSEDSPNVVVSRQIEHLKLDFGIKSCLSVGIRGMLGTCTYFAFSNFDQKLLWKLRTMMQILAPHFHLAYLRASTGPEQDQPCSQKPALTPREEEIMRWVAEGKTNWEISIILKVSLNTVKFHLKNVYQKLGVENRWTAVAQWQWNDAGLLMPTIDRRQLETPDPPSSSSQ